MSGIVAVKNIDGAPLDRDLLESLTAALAFRGPDHQNIWISGDVGFGHTLFSTTNARQTEYQPATLHGRLWITGDVRIDDRAALTAKLKAKSRLSFETATDAELVLHAYDVWQTECLQHLIGDFAFVIWDGSTRRLFAARDQLGVKPLYYALKNNCLVISNTLNCVRKHPAASNRLNDLAIADFVMSGINEDQATTAFADISRLPPAHYLTLDDNGFAVKRYWSLAPGRQIRFKRARDYEENFQELMRAAVSDRLRTNRVGVYMSGGLDSTMVAAIAKQILSREFSSFDLRAYAVVFEKLFQDPEKHYSTLAAEEIGIPIHHFPADDYELFERWDQPELQTPEPWDYPLSAYAADQAKQIASHCRVVLSGWDGDTILAISMPKHFNALLRERKFGAIAGDMARLLIHKKLPLMNLLRRLQPPNLEPEPKISSLLKNDLAEKLASITRERQKQKSLEESHWLRIEAFRILTSANLTKIFESYDAMATIAPLDVRHPLLDLRVIDYCLSIPPIPWAVKKHLLRQSTRGILPALIRYRPKTPLAGDPVLTKFYRRGFLKLDVGEVVPEALDYLNEGNAFQISADEDSRLIWAKLRAFSLNYWLRNLY